MDELLATTITLPGGYQDAGTLHREVLLRAITGREEEILAERIGTLSRPVLVTFLISRCALRLGPWAPVTPELARHLLVADRDYLLLKLHQLTFGDHVHAVLACPACREKMDLDFDINQVSVTSSPPPGPGAAFELSSAAAYTDPAGHPQRHVEFRLPIGADQEVLAASGSADYAQALDVLLARCLLRLGPGPLVDESVVERLTPATRAEIEAVMERQAPLVDLEMDIYCPQCGHTFVQYFDFAAFLLEEIKLRRDQLYREVHTLALYYHWSESEILALPRKKRRAYIELLYKAQSTDASRGS